MRKEPSLCDRLTRDMLSAEHTRTRGLFSRGVAHAIPVQLQSLTVVTSQSACAVVLGHCLAPLLPGLSPREEEGSLVDPTGMATTAGSCGGCLEQISVTCFYLGTVLMLVE